MPVGKISHPRASLHVLVHIESGSIGEVTWVSEDPSLPSNQANGSRGYGLVV